MSKIPARTICFYDQRIKAKDKAPTSLCLWKYDLPTNEEVGFGREECVPTPDGEPRIIRIPQTLLGQKEQYERLAFVLCNQDESGVRLTVPSKKSHCYVEAKTKWATIPSGEFMLGFTRFRLEPINDELTKVESWYRNENPDTEQTEDQHDSIVWNTRTALFIGRKSVGFASQFHDHNSKLYQRCMEKLGSQPVSEFPVYSYDSTFSRNHALLRREKDGKYEFGCANEDIKLHYRLADETVILLEDFFVNIGNQISFVITTTDDAKSQVVRLKEQ